MNATKTENEKPALLHKLAPGAYGSAEFIGRPFAADENENTLNSD
jgi:hypothetical protein